MTYAEYNNAVRVAVEQHPDFLKFRQIMIQIPRDDFAKVAEEISRAGFQSGITAEHTGKVLVESFIEAKAKRDARPQQTLSVYMEQVMNAVEAHKDFNQWNEALAHYSIVEAGMIIVDLVKYGKSVGQTPEETSNKMIAGLLEAREIIERTSFVDPQSESVN